MQGRPVPLKPWERPGTQAGSNGGSPFAPSTTANSTATVVSASVANSEEKKDDAGIVRNVSIGDGNQMPLRPWERPATGYGSVGYNRPYGSVGYSGYGGTYGSDYNRGGQYGSLYGNYGGTYGGSSYGSGYGYGGYGGYGGGMYNRYGAQGGMGSYGMGPPVPYGGYGPMDPNMPDGNPPQGPPSFWETMLRTMHGVVSFFGRISILVDENTQAIHFFITALLQLCDRTGVLYGELARFVLRLLGFRTRSRPRPHAPNKALLDAGTNLGSESQGMPKGSDGAWDHVWSDK